MNFWDRIEATADSHDVLEHPFYVRWSAGELDRDELALYAGQYAHAVQALAVAARHAADTAADPAVAAELAEHAAEEESHVALWSQFARALGAPAEAPALPETRECVAAWADPRRDLLATLVAIYAIESAQPAIAVAKAAGLRERYGITDAPATAYFDLHASRDVEHARAGRALIDARLGELGPGEQEALVAEAARVLEANWRLLDGVEREHAAIAT